MYINKNNEMSQYVLW